MSSLPSQSPSTSGVIGGRGGGVPADHIIGEAIVIWWSRDARGGVQTERIGARLQDVNLRA